MKYFLRSHKNGMPKNVVAVRLITRNDPAWRHPKSRCKNCPYGKDFPCIGWCMKEILKQRGDNGL